MNGENVVNGVGATDKYASQKRWNEKNKEKMEAYRKDYYQKHKDKIKATARAWQDAHRQPRKCRVCGVDIGKGKTYCEPCRKEAYRLSHLKAQKKFISKNKGVNNARKSSPRMPFV